MTKRTVLTTLVSTVAFAAPASAAPPVKQQREVIPYEFAAPCEGFDILVSGVETIERTTYLDRDGDPVRVVSHDRFLETDTNSVSGTAVRLSGRQREEVDFVAGTRTVTGPVFKMTIPGRGVVIHDAGRVVFDAPFHVVFEAGTHDVLHGNIDSLACAALAGV
jgi:hypothetical protein